MDLLDDDELKSSTKDGSSRRRTTTDRWSRLVTDRWLGEICATLVSLLSMVAIVLVLRLHEGRPLPRWPFSITINSLVSVFTTIMKATMLVPIAAGISQAKWHWFRQHQTLNDIEVYDQASRGPWGALKLLWSIRWRHLSSLGAFVTVLALAIDPFVQQVAFPRLQVVPLPQNTTLSVLRASTATFSTEGGIKSIQGSIYGGLFGVEDFMLSPNCTSGNCTWGQYQTLAVCSHCVNITDHIQYIDTVDNKHVSSCSYNYGAFCYASLPNGLSLGQIAGQSGSLNTSGKLPPITLNRVGYPLVNFSLITSEFQAIECSLYWCVNTYTAAVNNTVFTENLQSSWFNQTSDPPFADLSNTVNFNLSNRVFYNISPPTGGSATNIPVNLTSAEMNILEYDGLTPDDYIVEQNPNLGAWLGPLLTGSASQLTDSGSAPALPASDVVALFQNSNLTQTSATFARVAQYLTVFYRNTANALDPETDLGPAQALGVAWEDQTIVVVRWAWLILPCALLALTMLSLGFTIAGSVRGGVPIWKSNTLALLFHGLGGGWEEHGNGEDIGHMVDMEHRARRVRVQLFDDGGGREHLVIEKRSLAIRGD